MRQTFLFLAILLAYASTGVEGVVAGGLKEIDYEKENVDELLKNITLLWNDKYDGNSFYKISELLSIKKQIVSGVKYVVNVEFVRTICTREEMAKLKRISKRKLIECRSRKDPRKSTTCVIDYWVQAWTNTYKITNAECDDFEYSSC